MQAVYLKISAVFLKKVIQQFGKFFCIGTGVLVFITQWL